MKKLCLIFTLLFVFLTGCSDVNSDIQTSSIELVTSFFNDINTMEDYSDEAKLVALQQYFTADSEIKETLVNYLTVFESERQTQLVNYNIANTKVTKFNDLYCIALKYDILSKKDQNILLESSMNLYLSDENGTFKIETGDYGG